MGTRTASRSALARKARTERALREMSARAETPSYSSRELLTALASEIDYMAKRYPPGHLIEQTSTRDRARMDEIFATAARIVGVEVRELRSMARNRDASTATENRSEVLKKWQQANRMERR